MNEKERTEARILDSSNILIVLSKLEEESLLKNFHGSVIAGTDPSADLPSLSGKSVYLCGDLSKVGNLDLRAAARIFVIRELSHGDEDGKSWPLVSLGQVPILIHGVGVYYRRFFEPGADYFHRICAEHTFQSLTESTKPGKAHRTGIYLTPVEQDGEELHFRLLRCSTNLAGPTENFRLFAIPRRSRAQAPVRWNRVS